MGSVQSNVECPQCKSPDAVEDFYFKSNEVYVWCDNCGYSYRREIQRNNDGKFIVKCFKCGHEGLAKKENEKECCEKCGVEFVNIFKVLIYDEMEQRGKGSIVIAGILFTCPACGEDSCPEIKEGIYYCKNRKCEKPFDEKTTKEMLKRKKISGLQSVQNIPETISDEEVEKYLDDIKNDGAVVLIKKQLWDGKINSPLEKNK